MRSSGRPARDVWVGRGLAARILLLVVSFLLLGEVLIFVPSIARFRTAFLEQRIAAAHLASLVRTAETGGRIAPELEQRLLDHSGTLAITVRDPRPRLMLGHDVEVERTVDLDHVTAADQILQAFETLVRGGDRNLRVFAAAPMEPGAQIEIVIDEGPMRAEMFAYAWRILALSLTLSVIVAILVLWRLQRLIVRPLAKITEHLARFRRTPEDAGIALLPSRRGDEIGVVEREVRDMQQDLRTALLEQSRLAAVGGAVGRINHDLRNMLAGALLVSDRLERSEDPAVRRSAPRLIRALQRATRLCETTLAFARERPPPLRPVDVDLHELLDDVAADLAPTAPAVEMRIEAADGLFVRVDRDAVYRVVVNLARNGLRAMPGGGTLSMRARWSGRGLAIEIADTGHGIAQARRETLFVPFATDLQTEGSGLGLAICREIMRRHGGDVRLVRTGGEGTTFALELPARAVTAGGDARRTAAE
ncbi:MAG: HAMP domain-containing histidine kinase [Geminicoccaceae bacterium]|nr:HAMP domain-containing histidine kinase [Geminicoccaceae bacterium]